MNKPFVYDVNFVPLKINNASQDELRDKLRSVPYLLYEVEQLANGDKIVINKPGGKRSFGRLSRNDFMVFIFSTIEKTLWLISHEEIKDDLQMKYDTDSTMAIKVIEGLYKVCQGAEPDIVIRDLSITCNIGLSVETIYKVYKWIWGQEDCNYPNGEGRWLSMNGILGHFQIMDLTKEWT